MTNAVRHVDGPMLPHLYHRSNSRVSSSLVPLLTPPLSANDSNNQFILIPNSRRIVVRCANRGTKLFDLLPPPTKEGEDITSVTNKVGKETAAAAKVDDSATAAQQDDDDDNVIHAVTVAWLPSSSRDNNKSGTKDDDSNDDDDSDDDEESSNDDSTTDDDDDDDDDDNYIDDDERRGEWIILAGCKGGIIHEWSISDLSSSSSSISPRRSFHLTSVQGGKTTTTTTTVSDLIHLASPSSTSCNDVDNSPPPNAKLYGLIIVDNTTKESSSTSSWMVRFIIPPFVRKQHLRKGNSISSKIIIPLRVTKLASMIEGNNKNDEDNNNNDKDSYMYHDVRLRTGDRISNMFVASRLRSSSSSLTRESSDYYALEGSNDGGHDVRNVFIVLCTSHSIIVYRDCHEEEEDDDDDTTPSKSSRSRLIYLDESTSGGGPLISAAISPDSKDLALGRSSGHINILYNVFDYVSNCLDGGDEQPKMMMSHYPSSHHRGASRRHTTTKSGIIRRTLHWHSNPVSALTYTTAGRGGGSSSTTMDNVPATLLSGGEESVLVSWELEQNYHRPTNFVSRVGRGGIVSILPCHQSGSIIIFCSDDTIQRFAGPTYERQWSVHGLASMELYEEEEGVVEDVDDRHVLASKKRGPIIVVKDPITSYPMLTNLPGAPGMIHWYDPTSASVVGTLEVAPFNRVSRKDPKYDPHIPTPTVSHMAIGRTGKDMVTVDTVWTENASVGKAYDLIGPQGTIVPMNVCTSIKFWRHVDLTSRSRMAEEKRKRRNGDVPMSYELVSSMASPHGRSGEVCALAVAPDGNVACTLSQEEDTYRIWVKSTDPPVGLWKCHYKVKSPSGFANLMSQGVNEPSSNCAFSADGTVLSVSYGPYVTLWDHSDATLLTSLSLNNTTVNPSRVNEKILSVNFLPGNDDLMLLTTASLIGIKSPFGGAKSCYLGDDEWTLDVASVFGEGSTVSAVLPLIGKYEYVSGGSGGLLAVSICTGNGSKSIISIIHRETGTLMISTGTDTPMQWRVNGEVQSLYLERSLSTSYIQLLAITKDGQLYSLSCGIESGQTSSNGIVPPSRNSQVQAPVLKVGNKSQSDAERPFAVKKRKVSIGNSLGGDSDRASNLSSFVFPTLSGKYTCAFVAQQGLKRNRGT